MEKEIRTLADHGIFAQNYDGQRLDAEKKILTLIKDLEALQAKYPELVNANLLSILKSFANNFAGQLNLSKAREIIDTMLDEIKKVREKAGAITPATPTTLPLQESERKVDLDAAE